YESNQPEFRAVTLKEIAEALNAFGDKSAALQTYKKRLTLLDQQSSPSRNSRAETIKSIGKLSYELGLTKDAVENYDKAAKIWFELVKVTTSNAIKRRYASLATSA